MKTFGPFPPCDYPLLYQWKYRNGKELETVWTEPTRVVVPDEEPIFMGIFKEEMNKERRKHFCDKYGRASGMLSKVIGQFTPNDVLPFVGIGQSYRSYMVGGISYSVCMTSKRYKVFKRSLNCVACNLQATVALLEQHAHLSGQHKGHFDFYGEKDGMLILMTKDHIKPISQEGKNHISNLQTCCYFCNNFLKSAYPISNEQFRDLRALFDANSNLTEKKLWQLISEARKEMVAKKQIESSTILTKAMIPNDR